MGFMKESGVKPERGGGVGGRERGVRVTKKSIYREGDCLKRGTYKQFADLRRGLDKKYGVVFLRGV